MVGHRRRQSPPTEVMRPPRHAKGPSVASEAPAAAPQCGWTAAARHGTSSKDAPAAKELGEPHRCRAVHLGASQIVCDVRTWCATELIAASSLRSVDAGLEISLPPVTGSAGGTERRRLRTTTIPALSGPDLASPPSVCEIPMCSAYGDCFVNMSISALWMSPFMLLSASS